MKKSLLFILLLASVNAVFGQITLNPSAITVSGPPTTVTVSITDTNGFADATPTNEFAIVVNSSTTEFNITPADATDVLGPVDLIAFTFTIGSGGSGADVIVTESGSFTLTAVYVDNNGTVLTSSGVVLPVELTGFEAKKAGKVAQISWATALEINNDFFSVMRSVDGKNFEEIGQINGLGTDLKGTTYEYTDDLSRVEAATVYYQLAQTDFDGQVTEFEIVSIDNQSNQTSTIDHVYNQFGRLQASINLENAQQMDIRIVDLSGRLIHNQQVDLSAGLNELSVDMPGLTNGLYFVNFRTEGLNITKKIMH